MKSGFSLIELIVSIVIVAIIAAVTVPLFVEVVSSWALAVQRNDMCDSARIAMDRMVREIRQVKSNTSVLAASGTNFQFIDVNSNTITFNRSSNSLMRGLGGSSNSLADNVTSLTFTYYDSSGTVISTPIVSPLTTDIRRIAIDITFSNGGTQFYFESAVSPRSLR